MLFSASCTKDTSTPASQFDLIEDNHTFDAQIGQLYWDKTNSIQLFVPNQLSIDKKSSPYNKSWTRAAENVWTCQGSGDTCYIRFANGGVTVIVHPDASDR